MYRYFLFLFLFTSFSIAQELQVGAKAPDIKLKADDGSLFDLSSRKGSWTVIYFFPKADTPGCTKQACAYRDSISKFKEQEVEVYGISADDVADLVSFKKKHELNFTLLSDKMLSVISAYGVKRKDKDLSLRWTFVIDPDLKIAAVEKDVDPVLDSDRIATRIKKLKNAYKR